MATSVVIANHNGQDLLPDCLVSLGQQTLQPGEIVVVDNGSVDGSMGLLERDFPHVHVIRLPENVGFARANNIGIEHTSGDRVALLNNDTVADAHWLAELNRALDDHGDVGSCASKMLNYWQPHLVDSAGDLLGVARAFNRGHGQPLTTELDQPELVFGACAGAAIYRRSMLQRIGLFDEFFVTNLEDADLSFRAQLAGYRCLYVPTAVVFHKRGETKRRVGWSGFFTERNNRLFWLKNAPARLMLANLGALLLNELRFWRRCFPEGTGGIPLPSAARLTQHAGIYLAVLRALPHVVRERRRVQKGAVVSWRYLQSFIDDTRSILHRV